VMEACGSSGVALIGGGPISVYLAMVSVSLAVRSGGCGVASSSCNNSPGLAAALSLSCNNSPGPAAASLLSCNNILVIPDGVELACCSGMEVCGLFLGGVRGVTVVGDCGEVCLCPAGD